MNAPRLAGILSVAALSLLVWSCDAPVAPPSGPEAASAPLFGVDCAARPDHPKCDGSGGGGGDGGSAPTYTLELSGAMSAAETPVEIQRDNKRTLRANGNMDVSFAFDLTGANCTLGLPDGYGGNAAELEDLFSDVLTGATGSPSTRAVTLGVNKQDATGAVHPLPLVEDGDDRWVSLGFNTGGPANVSGDFDGPGDRVLTYTGGNVRVVARLNADSWEVCSSTVACGGGDPIADYVCSGWSESVVATLRESP